MGTVTSAFQQSRPNEPNVSLRVELPLTHCLSLDRASSASSRAPLVSPSSRRQRLRDTRAFLSPGVSSRACANKTKSHQLKRLRRKFGQLWRDAYQRRHFLVDALFTPIMRPMKGKHQVLRAKHRPLFESCIEQRLSWLNPLPLSSAENQSFQNGGTGF